MKISGHDIIYRDHRFFSAFPSLVRYPDGELLLAFRRAPERRWYGGRCTHADPNSQLVLVRSGDDGCTWSSEPELIHAHALGGSQDPCMTLLADGSLICASYLWVLQQPGEESGGSHDYTGWQHSFGGGYLVRSQDRGRHWSNSMLPPPVPGGEGVDGLGQPVPAYNRGNILLGSDGTLYWAVVRKNRVTADAPLRTSVHLMVSEDGGNSWQYRCPIAESGEMIFNETWLYETEAGDLVAFLRGSVNTIARSTDRGRSFSKWHEAGFVGHPHCACRLNDGRVLLVYGYRGDGPFGIRARVLNSDCSNSGTADEIVLRDDGGSPDLGYPWPIVFPDGRVLVVYYFNDRDDPDVSRMPAVNNEASTRGVTAGGGVRYIAGTWLQP